MHISYVLIIAVSLVNFLSTIILVGTGFSKGVHMLYTILNIIIFIPLAMFVFWNGYYGLCKRPRVTNHLWRYRIMQGVLCILWFIFSILSAGTFNGWAEISNLKADRLYFNIFLSVIESLLYMASCALGAFCVYMSFRVEDEEPCISASEARA